MHILYQRNRIYLSSTITKQSTHWTWINSSHTFPLSPRPPLSIVYSVSSPFSSDLAAYLCIRPFSNLEQTIHYSENCIYLQLKSEILPLDTFTLLRMKMQCIHINLTQFITFPNNIYPIDKWRINEIPNEMYFASNTH